MLITRQNDYAMRVIRALTNDEKLTVKEICKKENIPQDFAYKILKKLEKGSIVYGYRGAKGGYRLIASPSSITLYDIYLAIEGEVSINECMQKSYECLNNIGCNHCKVHNEWISIQNQLIQIMRCKSLEEIFEE